MSGEELARMTLEELLVENRELRKQFSDRPAEQERLQRLQRWQADRLEKTYADLHEKERYRPGVEFFLEELYTDKDYLPRDTQLEKASPILTRMLPSQAQTSMRMAVQLEVLSQDLDGEMVRALSDAGTIDAQTYAAAYRRVGRREDRQQQIELILAAGRDLERLVRMPLIWTLVRMAHGPAHLAGFGALHDFLEDGFRAFRAMGGAGEFLRAIEDRETAIMERILAEDPDPFRLDEQPAPQPAPAGEPGTSSAPSSSD